MSENPVFTPPTDERRWVSKSTRMIASEFIIQFDHFSPTIFRVPKDLSETKPEAYTPQLLGLGPYHHLRPELHPTDTQKLAVFKKCITQGSQITFKNLDPVIRASYDKYLDLEGTTLEYIMAVDSLYLLDFLGAYGENTEAENLEPGLRELAKDVVMLENQIPAFGLAEMGKEIDLFNHEIGTRETMLFSQLFYYFCKAHSPLEVAELWGNRRNRSDHLLAHMYYLIVQNRGARESDIMHKRTRTRITELGTEVLTVMGGLGLGGGVDKLLLFAFKTADVWENSKLSEEMSKVKEQKPKVEKIQIPSAVELSERHNVDFKLLERGGIRDIEFEIDKQTLHLPKIALRYDSEVVIRNLVAYEAAIATPESTLELAEYVDLMCGLVHTHKDVAFLCDKGIVSGVSSNEQVVKGKLNSEQVADIFNGISRSEGKSKEESASQRAVKELKEMVEKRENQKLSTRVKRTLKTNAESAIELMKKPSGIALKYALYIMMVLLLVLQILQAYCQVYGCDGGLKSRLSS